MSAYLLMSMMFLNQIQEELEHVIGCGRQPTWCDRCDLPYCHAVMLEVFRFRPAGPLAVPHLATYNTKLMGYDIPKGTTVLVNIYAAHFDPDYWDNPELFRPERFLSKDGKEVVKPTHGSYLPFGIGILHSKILMELPFGFLQLYISVSE